MTTPEPEAKPGRELAPCETGFWAFLEYPVFWIPALGFMLLMLIAPIVLMILGVKR